jgi:hypothetical protein
MDREIIKIAVSPEAKQAIERVCARYGMTQIELASRLYTWLAGADEVTQAAVLGILPDTVASDIARLILQRMATEPRQDVSPAAGESAGAIPLTKAAKPARAPVHVTKSVAGKLTPRRKSSE